MFGYRLHGVFILFETAFQEPQICVVYNVIHCCNPVGRRWRSDFEGNTNACSSFHVRLIKERGREPHFHAAGINCELLFVNFFAGVSKTYRFSEAFISSFHYWLGFLTCVSPHPVILASISSSLCTFWTVTNNLSFAATTQFIQLI